MNVEVGDNSAVRAVVNHSNRNHTCTNMWLEFITILLSENERNDFGESIFFFSEILYRDLIVN